VKKIIALLSPFYGFLFLTAYIRSATVNVVYTDYMRLVNSYLENVWSFAPYMHGDILTRIPVNYLERIINVTLFSYSTTFDMMLGAAGLAFSAAVAARWCLEKELPVRTMLLVQAVIFSLNKWEMLTNGSGWVHFAAFGLFWYHYMVWDRAASSECGGLPARRGDASRLLILPPVIILLFAGPYCAVYAVTLLIGEAFSVIVMKCGRAAAAKRSLAVLVPLLLYIASRSVAVEERAGATTESIVTVAGRSPMLLPEFFVRSFASMAVGGEAAEHLKLSGGMLTALGGIVLLLYAAAFFLNFRQRLYLRTTFPLLLLTAGFLNHVLITASRWIFLDPSYGMSSRYALQYQIGIVGILVTFAVSAKEDGLRVSTGNVPETAEGQDAGQDVPRDAVRRAEKRVVSRQVLRGLTVFSAVLILAGNLVTTAREIHMAAYRQERFLLMRETALDFENRTDAELKDILQYHDPERTRKALTLLKERRLNIYE